MVFFYAVADNANALSCKEEVDADERTEEDVDDDVRDDIEVATFCMK